ncbi:MAG: biotin/lipoyl-containing protein, partial [Solirubrobacteraceae bacterium]
MSTEIVMPRLSDSMEEGTILQWFVAEGDVVGEGQPLVEVETDKASVTYEAEGDGTVLALAAAVGDSVAVGATIAVIGDGGEAATVGSAKGDAGEEATVGSARGEAATSAAAAAGVAGGPGATATPSG